MTLDKLDKCISLVIAKEILGQRGLPVKSCVIQPGCGKFVRYKRVVETLTETTPRKNTGKNAVTQKNLIKTDNLLKKKHEQQESAVIKQRICETASGAWYMGNAL